MKVINGKILCVITALLLLAGAYPLVAAGRKTQNKFSPLAYSMRSTRKTPNASARAAFSRFSAVHGKGWKIRYNPRTALPEAITGGRTRRYAGGPEQAARSFFRDNSELIQIDPAALSLVLRKENMGLTHLQYQQSYKGLPVEFAYARVHVTATGEVAGYQARFEPEIDLNIVPGISAAQAVFTANADLGAQLAVSKTELVIFPDEEAGALKLAWKIRGRAGGLWVYYIDAQAGRVLLKYDDLRRWCDPAVATMGSSSGTVYDISPVPTGSTWVNPVVKSMSDQYFWIGGYINRATTTVTGSYCSATPGKVFSSFKGPYFSVTNFRGPSAHYDNGQGEWRSYDHPAWTASANPYPNSSSIQYPSITVVPALTGDDVLAKVMPIFSTFDLQTGEISPYDGIASDGDLLNVSQGLDGSNVMGSYIGVRQQAFYGPAVENNAYTLTLKTDDSGTSSGFTINQSSYMVLTAAPSVPNNGTGSVIWSTYTTNASGLYYLNANLGPAADPISHLDEVNAFYHLNKARRYFQTMNIDPANSLVSPANLDIPVPVMVHASARPDVAGDWMDNAYFDLENENIFFGDGWSGTSPRRSYALDGTIVRHEYTHLAMHRIYPIINFGEFGAISEGLADYFSLASFWKEGSAEANAAKQNLNVLGNFLGVEAGRAINGACPGATCRKLPDNWVGEIYADSLIFSQALYRLRAVGGTNSLGLISAGVVDAAAVPRADFLIWSALFYFPDSYANFYEAMIDACTQLNAVAPGECTSGALSHAASITAAFSAHGMLPSASVYGEDSYENGSNNGLCVNNNGPECAADMTALTAISAKIIPEGDADYYSLPLGAGNFQATLALPELGDTSVYQAYAISLLDSDRNIVAEAFPNVNLFGAPCPSIGDCPTLDASVALTYTVTSPGRYYLWVRGAPTEGGSNSGVTSALPYTLTFTYAPRGGVSASLGAGSSADNDLIDFQAQSNAMPVGNELFFQYAQLRDHNNNKLARARTDFTLAQDSVLQLVSSATIGSTITGAVRIQPGFARAYPGAGTVVLEVFGLNHMGNVISLGVSNAINLSSNKAAITTYNNQLGAPGAKTIIKYELLTQGMLSIKVYTQTGALVKTLYDGPAAGKGTVNWDGTNTGGGKAASGIYFVKAKGPGLDKTDKIAVVR